MFLFVKLCTVFRLLAGISDFNQKNLHIVYFGETFVNIYATQTHLVKNAY